MKVLRTAWMIFWGLVGGGGMALFFSLTSCGPSPTPIDPTCVMKASSECYENMKDCFEPPEEEEDPQGEGPEDTDG